MTTTFHPDLVLTDRALFNDNLEPDERIVLAATLGFFERLNPSLTQLEKATGLCRRAVIAAQNRLEAWKGDVRLDRSKLPQTPEGMQAALRDLRYRGIPIPGTVGADRWSPVAVFDRPANPWEREKNNPRFRRSTRLVELAAYAHPGEATYVTRLPGAIAARLPRGRGITNGAELRLVAMFYAREQLRRGAIQVEDEVVARKLGLQVLRNGFFDGPNVKQVRRLREKLVEHGILVVVDAGAHPCPIYVMPGGTPQRPENPDGFEPGHTRRFRRLFDVFPPPGDVFDLYASDSELEQILTLTRKLGATVAYDALDQAGIDVAYGEPDAPEVLEALTRCRMSTLSRSNEHPVMNTGAPWNDQMSTGTSTSTTTSTPSGGDEGASAKREPGAEEDEAGKEEKARQLPRREWSLPGLDLPLFYFAADDTHEAIAALYEAARATYDQEEATGYLRNAILEHGPIGRDVLAFLRRLLPRIAERLDLAERLEESGGGLDLGGFQNVAE